MSSRAKTSSNGLTNGVSNGLTNGVSNGVADHGVELGSSSPSSSHGSEYHWLKLLTISASGALFGYAAKITNVFLPQVIRNQMVFQDFTMLKVFLAATVGGTVCFMMLSILPSSRGLFKSIRSSFGSCVDTKQMLAFAGGGLLLGMGMTISGACPGMVFAQIGSGNSGSLYTLLGCFCGALVYGVLEPTLTKWFRKKHTDHSRTVWVDEMVGVSYTTLALPFTLALVGGLFLSELYVPHTEEMLAVDRVSHPVIGGLIMGSLQLLVGLSVKDSLGGSSSYCTILSRLGLSSVIPYFKNYKSGMGNWWQVIYWVSAVGATALTSYLTGTWGQGDPVSPVMGLIGGFMMVFGARLASGCTSGHGLSGMALLSYYSFIAVASMFAGGIALEVSIRMLHS